MKICLSCLVIWKIQIKTIMKYYYVHINRAVIKNPNNSKVGEDIDKLELSYTSCGNGKWHKHFGKLFDSFLIKLNICISYHPAVPQ